MLNRLLNMIVRKPLVAAIVVIVGITLIDVGIVSITTSIRSASDRAQIIHELLKVEEISKTKEEDYKKDFMNKTFMARQVYQFSWYKVKGTKVGDLNLNKYYAMNNQEYDHLCQNSWQYNRLLSVPLDSWMNYIPLAKWIMESAIYLYAEHKTGEIIRMTGYTMDGYVIALFHYKYSLNIVPGHPLYVQALENNRSMNKDDISRIFTDIDNVTRFDYAYLWHLCQAYDYRWDWVLTAFHYGEAKTEYWQGQKLTSIPNYRLDGKWCEEDMRDYYLAIYEIAQGIAMGKLDRISKFEAYVKEFASTRTAEIDYINTLRLKARSEDKMRSLEESYMKMKNDFSNYKVVNSMLLKQMGDLNEMTIDKKDADRAKIRGLKNTIIQTFKELRKR
jgi:hypothetical protein